MIKIKEHTDDLNGNKKEEFLLNCQNIPSILLHHKILTSSKKPDFVGILILTELASLHYLYREAAPYYDSKGIMRIYSYYLTYEISFSDNISNNEFPLNYRYFNTKFNLTYSQVNQAIKRLEKQNLVKRNYRNVNKAGRICNNEMFLILNLDNYLKLCKSQRSEEFSLPKEGIKNYALNAVSSVIINKDRLVERTY